MKKSELKTRIKELEDELFEARVEAETYKRLYEQSTTPQIGWPTPAWQPDITFSDKTWAPPFDDWCQTTIVQQKVDEMNEWIEKAVERMHIEAEDTRNAFVNLIKDK